MFPLLLPPMPSPTSTLEDTCPFTDGGCGQESLWDQPQAANLSRKDDTCYREGRHRSWSEHPPIPRQEGVSYGAMVLPTQAPRAPWAYLWILEPGWEGPF